MTHRFFAQGIGGYCISEMPNQPMVAWCHSFFVDPAARGRRNAHMLKYQQGIDLKNYGFSSALCSVRADNIPMRRVLDVAGWKQLSSFHDPRQNVDVEIWSWGGANGSQA